MVFPPDVGGSDFDRLRLLLLQGDELLEKEMARVAAGESMQVGGLCCAVLCCAVLCCADRVVLPHVTRYCCRWMQ